MKKLLVLSLFPAFAIAQPIADIPTRVKCFNAQTLIKELESEFEEIPQYRADSGNGQRIVIFTSKTGNYTIVAFPNRQIGCVLSAGINFTPIGNL